MARGWPIEVRRELGNHVTTARKPRSTWATYDVVWLRQDPPFDMGYITTTHLLEMIHPKTLVVNDPVLGAEQPGKAFGPALPDPDAAHRHRPRSGHDPGLQGAAWRHHPQALVWQRRRGVFRLDPNDRNLSSLHELFMGINREPLIVQKFLPDVSKGDKRVILVDGEPVGAINRVPQAGRDPVEHACGGRPKRWA
jgi:glutathione synthase